MKTIMKKKLLGPVVLLIGIILVSYSVYGLTTLSWTQKLTVPLGNFIAYRSDGTTEITNGSNQTDIWTWNGATYSFNTTIIIKNNGTSTINVKVEATLDPFWKSNGFGTQTLIVWNSSRTVNLSIYNINATSGQSVDPFNITMTMVP